MEIIKNVLEFINKESFIEYLDTLSEKELELEFNLCDNLEKEVFHLLQNAVKNIFISFYCDQLDDIYLNKIDNLNEYCLNYFNNFSLYLDSLSADINKLSKYNNTEELKVNSFSYLITCENKSIKEVIIYIYDMLLTDNFDKMYPVKGLYNRLLLLVSTLKEKINEYLSQLNNGCDNNNCKSELINNNNNFNNIIETLFNLSEDISSIHFNSKRRFKELMNPSSFEILEKYNLINKLSLMLMNPLYGIDTRDIADVFNESKISKIIMNGKEIFINPIDEYTTIFNLMFNKENISFTDIEEKNKQLRLEYKEDVDILYGLVYREDSEVIIILGK